jgi:putative transposase
MGRKLLHVDLRRGCEALAAQRVVRQWTVLPSADTAAMSFWALLASGQINMRKVDGWQTLTTNPIHQPIDLAA